MKTVLTHGCFDVLHIGHIRLLKHARTLGDELVVSLLADKYVSIAKGPSRPIHTLHERIEQLSELRCVDRVVVVNGPGHEAVERMIAQVWPAVYVKGANSKGAFGEEDFVRSMRIEMVFFDVVPEKSTTGIVDVASAFQG